MSRYNSLLLRSTLLRSEVLAHDQYNTMYILHEMNLCISEPTAQMLEVLYIFQQQMMMRTMLDSGNLLPDLQIMLTQVIYCQIFVKVKTQHKIRSKVDKNCASDWTPAQKKWPTPPFLTNAFFETFLRCFHCDNASILKIKDFMLVFWLTYHNLKLIIDFS
jgi:hypothetical protein